MAPGWSGWKTARPAGYFARSPQPCTSVTGGGPPVCGWTLTDPEGILRRHYAAGEIDEDEYLRRMSGLSREW
jgi:hypothetical protein